MIISLFSLTAERRKDGGTSDQTTDSSEDIKAASSACPVRGGGLEKLINLSFSLTLRI